ISDSAAHPSSQTIPHTSPDSRCGPHESTSPADPATQKPRQETAPAQIGTPSSASAPFHAAESSSGSRRDTAPSAPPTLTRPPAPSPSSAHPNQNRSPAFPSARARSPASHSAPRHPSSSPRANAPTSPSPLVRLFSPSKLPRPAYDAISLITRNGICARNGEIPSYPGQLYNPAS